MKTFLRTFFFMYVILFIHSFEMKAQIFNWAKSMNVTNVDSIYGYAISTDANGNSYVTGFFEGKATFGTIHITDYGPPHIFIAKFDLNGNCLWAKEVKGTNWDQGNGISVDASGNSYITGYFAGTATFDAIELTGYGSNDIFIAKYDPNGICLWANKAGGTGGDAGYGISVDVSGNTYLTGSFSGTAAFGTIPLTSAGGNDIFIAKYDPYGNCIWAKKAGGTNGDQGNGITMDASGKIYITGYFKGTASFGLNQLTSSYNAIFITKYDTTGLCIWAKQASGSSDDYGQSISVDALGNSYVTGSIAGTTSFDAIQLTSYGYTDIFTAKYDPSGNCIWANQAGSDNYDRGYGISADAYGNIYVTGYFRGTSTFGTFQVITAGTNDVFIANYDPNGICSGVIPAGGTSNDIGYGVSIDAIGHTYITGHYQSTATFGSIQLSGLPMGGAFITSVNNNLLPVEISIFSSTTSGRDINLNWETKTEKNSNIFEIERSFVDNMNWVIVGNVKAAVLSNSPKYYSFADRNLQSGKYQYRLKMIDNDGTFQYSSIVEAEVAVPKNFELSQNFPNPFNPNTVISYSLPLASDVTLIVYNSLGQTVKVLENGYKNAGTYSVNFNATELPSGTYYYKIEAGQFSQIKKMILLK
jgi:hypothetical protein